MQKKFVKNTIILIFKKKTTINLFDGGHAALKKPEIVNEKLIFK